MRSSKSSTLPEPAARRVLLVQAFETGREAKQWSVDDRHWATRLARESWAGVELPAQALAQRAGHVLERLKPRHPSIDQVLRLKVWEWHWTLVAAAAGLLFGVLLDAFGGTQHINLLAPPIWAVVLWNLLVYALLPLSALLPAGLRERLSPRVAMVARMARFGPARGPLVEFSERWGSLVAPLFTARVAMTLHLTAAALAVGMIGSLYVRGLALDYRAGWQSTFLEAPTVQSLLNKALAPASVFIRTPVPDVKPLRTSAVEPPRGPAAIWVHLYAATLMLAVVLPRLLLALLAGAKAWRDERALPLSLQEPYFQQLLRELKGAAEVAWVLPHGAAPSPQAVQGVRDWLAAALGQDVLVQFAPPVPYGQERTPARAPTTPTLVVLLVDLATTPESDSHGTLLTAMSAIWPDAFHLVLADSAEFTRRFEHVPERSKERRALWRGVAARRRAGFVSVDLAQPELEGAMQDLQACSERIGQFAQAVAATTGR